MNHNDIISKRYHKTHPIWPFVVVGNKFLIAGDGNTALYIFQKCMECVNNNDNNTSGKKTKQLGLIYTLGGDATFACNDNSGKENNKLRLGITYYERAIEVQYNTYDAHFGMANNLKALGKFEDALVQYQIAIDEVRKEDTTSLPPSYIFNIAQCYEALARYDDAIDIIDASYNAFWEVINGTEIDDNYIVYVYASIHACACMCIYRERYTHVSNVCV